MQLVQVLIATKTTLADITYTMTAIPILLECSDSHSFMTVFFVIFSPNHNDLIS